MLTLERRKQAESEIVRATIEAAHERGWLLDIVGSDDDETRVHSVDEAMEHAFACDEAYIFFTKGKQGDAVGESRAWLYIVLGNSGWDVISDYTTNLDDAIKSTEALVSKWEKEDAR